MGEDDENIVCADLFGCVESETDEDGFVHPVHGGAGQFADALLQAAFVDGPYLFQKDDAVLGKPVGGGQLDVGREPGFVDLARDGGGDDGGGILVSDVVLDDEYRADSSLFAADFRTSSLS